MEKDVNSQSIMVIIATLNEEEGIGPSLSELKEVLGNANYLIVDGNSTDRTIEKAKAEGVEIMFQDGFGKGGAIAQGLKLVGPGVKYIIYTDGDFTYPASYIPQMIQILEENPEVGMVTGDRFNHSLELSAMKSPFFVGNRFLAFVQRFLNGVHLNDPLTGLRVIRWRLLKNWEPKSKGFDIEAEMNFLVEKRGYKIVEVPIHYRSRVGEKKLKPKHAFMILRRIVSESITSKIIS